MNKNYLLIYYQIQLPSGVTEWSSWEFWNFGTIRYESQKLWLGLEEVDMIELFNGILAIEQLQ